MTALQQRVVDAIRDGVTTNWRLANRLGYSQNTLRRTTKEMETAGLIVCNTTQFGVEKVYSIAPAPETHTQSEPESVGV